MRILQVVPFFSPKFGGSIAVPYQLSRELAINGHDVTILTSDYGFDAAYANDIKKSGVLVIPFKTIINWGFFIYSPDIRPWLNENIQNFDIIHMHNYRSYQNIIVASFARKNKIEYLLQAHGSVLPIFQKQTLKKMFDLLWGIELLKNAKKVIAVSKNEREQYLQMGIPQEKIVIIPNGLDLAPFEILPKKGIFKKKNNISPEYRIILYLGRLHKSKGIEFLIDAYANLVKQVKNTKLVIVGPDEGNLDSLKQKVKLLKLEENILFTGPLYQNNKNEALVDASVLVYPSSIEIFGLVPFEALLCDIPVIVAESCGCGDIIQENRSGYLVPYGDDNKLSSQLKLIIENPADSQKMIQNGKNYIKEFLTWARIRRQFENVYTDCLLHK
jgi:glycosyltransferase involved in cell wall biosynthesis